MDTKDFLSEIYEGCREGYLTLTTLPERKTLWFKVSEIEKQHFLPINMVLKQILSLALDLEKIF